LAGCHDSDQVRRLEYHDFSRREAVRFSQRDIAETITRIKQQEGPDLHVYGSANLVQTLMKHDLVDAFWLKIFPVTLGSGKRLFADGTIPAAFKVTESTVTSKGVIIVNYERAGAVQTGSP
jgi:dihydrofolate reductase